MTIAFIASARASSSSARQAVSALSGNKQPFGGSVPIPTTTKLNFLNAESPRPAGRIPSFQVLDQNGRPLNGAQMPSLDKILARTLYKQMLLLPTLDDLLLSLQRQGKVSLHASSYGEEASIIGSAAALALDDEVLAQYREVGVLLWRGYKLSNVMNQYRGNSGDAGKGRQMPTHFGSPNHHFHTISSPLATQIPQAAGVGFALRRTPERSNRSIAVCYFGEGAASEGDFHAGMMMASTVPAPVLYIVRNNGWAISTPTTEQYAGDGIAGRGPGYGIDTIRVDGNDVLAMFAATRAARKKCLKEGRPVLLEAMTYRVGHHSTSDDSSKYRSVEDIDYHKQLNSPLRRFNSYLKAREWWNDEEDEALRLKLKLEVRAAFKEAEPLPLCELGDMFTDVYGGEEPWNLKEQRQELGRLLQKYGKGFAGWRGQLSKFKGHGQDLI